MGINVERVMARWGMSRGDLLCVVIFLHRHDPREDGPTLIHALFDYVRGIGPAAIAAGRAGKHLTVSSSVN